MNFVKEFIRDYYLAIISVLVLLLGVYLLSIFTEPVSTPQDVSITNISDRQATISYTTKNGTRDKIFVSDTKTFPRLLAFSDDYLVDDRDLNKKNMSYYVLHNITVGNLAPGKLYRYKVYQGVREVYNGAFSTANTLDSIAFPSPVYGRVVANDGITPIEGAIVYFQAINRVVGGKDSSRSAVVGSGEDERSSVLSTITNNEGRWSVDMGNLKTQDLRDSFIVGKGAVEKVVVNVGGEKFSAETVPGQDKPWPDIIVQSSK
ncbi:MAG: hypothetical protein C4584_00290 [Armatimonadetes bacterium]|nr:MAG: hypothetical protein C4584_00290 [Armatimonadota bacterium]